MKKTILTGILFIFVLIGYTQETKFNDIDIYLSAGPCTLNVSNGLTIQNAAMFSLNRYISVELNLTFANAYTGIKNKFFAYSDIQTEKGRKQLWDQNLYSLGLNCYFTPLKTKRHTIYLGAGPSLNHQVEASTDLANNNSSTILDIGNKASNGLGINLSVKYSFRITEKLSLGIKGYGIYFDDSNESILMSIGYQIN